MTQDVIGMVDILRQMHQLPGTTEFQQRVYIITRCIPFGYITTYGVIAELLNTSPRAVGQALKKNPFSMNGYVPCHRVVAIDSPGGYFGNNDTTIQTKLQLLQSEGSMDAYYNVNSARWLTSGTIYTILYNWIINASSH